MQTQIKILLQLMVLVSVTPSFAQNVNSQNIKSVLEKNDITSEEMDQVYDTIYGLITAKKESMSMKELMLLCMAYSKKENSDAPHELLYRLKLANKKEFEAALKELSSSKNADEKDSAKKIKEYVKGKEEEAKYGNG